MPLTLPSPDSSFANLSHRFEQDRDPGALLETRTSLVDALVLDAASRHLPPSSDVPFALCAVGGYGRRELFPYSDVDLLLVAGNEEQLKTISQALSEFLRVLWDHGLRISHSVRTIAECSRLHEDNPELHVSLLDRRSVAGSAELWSTFTARLCESFDRFRAAMIHRLVQLSRARHHKFNNTVFHLEPDIKETCGGIRDLHLVRWLSQLMPEREVLDDAVAELDAVTKPGRFETPRDLLFAQRVFLHLKAKRDTNLLTFEMQDQSAQFLPDRPVPPEEWMRLYFGHARRVFQSSVRALEFAESHSTSLVSQFRDWRSRLSTSEFTVSRERILLRNPAETIRSSEALLRLFTFSGRHGLRLSWDTQRRLLRALTPIRIVFERQNPAWSLWRDLFSQPHTAVALDEMQKTGLLSAAIPEWQSVESLVVRDFYHRYTVDEHTLVAIRSIDDLVNNDPSTPVRLRQLIAEEEKLPVLRLALLLHDIGKGTLPGDHVRGSLDTSVAVMQRLGVPAQDQAGVAFLISHHLDLSLVMNGRDLEDPATARFLTSQIGTQEDLRRLTLLTYADINAVNPTAMTPWRLEQLWQVYLLSNQQFTREMASNRLHLAKIPATLESELPELEQFLEGFPERYLRTHSPAQVRRHFEMASNRKNAGLSLSVEPEAGFWLLTVLTRDKPFLFASLCGVLASFGMNILKGEASSNAAGTVLDLIRFADPNRTLELNPEEVNRLEWTVECVVRGTLEVADLLKRRAAVRHFSGGSVIVPSVRFHNEASDSATLIDLTAEDRPGLLYDLAAGISNAGCNIEVVMIDTEAHRAADVFYVTRDGCKLDSQTQDNLQSKLLKAASAS